LADDPGVAFPAIDPRTGAQTIKSVPRSSTYGRVAFAGVRVDVPAGSTAAALVTFPFQIDLVQGFLFADQTDGTPDDLANFEIAPRTDLSVFTGGADVLNLPIAVGDKQITLLPPVLEAAVSYALIDTGFFRIEVEEGATKEDAVLLVTDYDDAPGGGTGVVYLGIFKAWKEGDAEPLWTGFDNVYTTAAKVLVTRIAVSNISVVPADATAFGSNGLDSAPIAPGVVFRVPYTNNSAVEKRARIVLQVLTGKPLPP
jgi:hypothetical protein